MKFQFQVGLFFLAKFCYSHQMATSFFFSFSPQTTSIIYNDGFCERHSCHAFLLLVRAVDSSFFLSFFDAILQYFSNKMSVPTSILCMMPAIHETTFNNWNFFNFSKKLQFFRLFPTREWSRTFLLRYLHFVIRQHSIQKLDFGFSHFLFTTLKHLPIWCVLLFIKIFAVWHHYHTIHIWWCRAFWKNKWHQWQQHQPQQQRL